MAKGIATMPRVLLGEILRQLRTDSKISLDEAARHIGKSRQRLTNLLDGVATLTAEELRALAIFLGAGSGQLKDIEALGIDARRKNAAGDPYTDVGPESWRRVAYLEAKA
ncbi:MAG: helix-turn-helix transcriptional regulator, partial [Actinomycetota bacterium]|nr:helix-turn-helix transcriptional regulator [Actinomycetota bacterium]